MPSNLIKVIIIKNRYDASSPVNSLPTVPAQRTSGRATLPTRGFIGICCTTLQPESCSDIAIRLAASSAISDMNSGFRYRIVPPDLLIPRRGLRGWSEAADPGGGGFRRAKAGRGITEAAFSRRWFGAAMKSSIWMSAACSPGQTSEALPELIAAECSTSKAEIMSLPIGRTSRVITQETFNTKDHKSLNLRRCKILLSCLKRLWLMTAY